MTGFRLTRSESYKGDETPVLQLKSARAAGRGAKDRRNPPVQPRFGGHDLRELLKSARAAGRGAKDRRNPPVQPRFGGHDLREWFLRRGNMPLKALCAATALIAAAQVLPLSAQFMEEMNAGMELMHRRMAEAPMTGNVDHDFASMMIPHHQGAIDMAKAELICGKDPVMRRLAQEILVDQQSEIDAMRLWLRNTAGARDKEK
jgi:hypothetical protein